MGCRSCGSSGTQPRSAQVSNIVITNTPMKQFIEEAGWLFTGNCGCRNNLNVYRSEVPAWNNYEVWMNVAGTRLEVRRRFGRDTKILGIGYTNNYEMVYHHHLPKIHQPL